MMTRSETGKETRGDVEATIPIMDGPDWCEE